MPSFIEKQFPVSKVSKESYKERKAVQSQTLTGLGKWWGRKPLILVRSAILGCLMPCSDNPKADMEIFLKILSMDNDGLLDRKQKPISTKELYEIAQNSKHFRQYLNDWFDVDKTKVKICSSQDKNDIETRLFKTLGYDEKLKYCVRPEQLSTLRNDSWNAINHHLGTKAHSLIELVEQLSMKRYGRLVTVGDCFSGGGSIPFEAARMGCNAYGSDLNPIASLLTWSSINILSSSDKERNGIKKFQKDVFDAIDKEITDLGIEHNEKGERATSYLYCVESFCPECGHCVPLLPSLIVGMRAGTAVAVLNENGNRYDIDVKMNVSTKEMKVAQSGTVTNKGLVCPYCGKRTPISILRGDRTDKNGNAVYGLRQWERSEFDFRDDDVYGERLYAIRYETSDGKRYYRSPNERDLKNEEKVKQIVAENIVDWQEKGLVPSMEIENGYNTDQVTRERGWTHWNHLFNARQLLLLSKLHFYILHNNTHKNNVAGLLGLNKIADYNTRICRWDPNTDISKQTFYNQALNTLFNWGMRSWVMLSDVWNPNLTSVTIESNSLICIKDARDVSEVCDFWITDPPYADAVNYHELSEFFLAWDKKLLEKTFPEWYTDSKRILAVRGDEHFSQTMIEIYTNIANHMPDDGMQVVMFTHSDPAVWAQLALIMWKSGLRVTAAWNIATETDAAGLKDGNYVKGTVLLILRKQTGDDIAFLDEINADIREEVKMQIESMQALEDKEEPNFSDPDYVLAAYAASLKVLTSYKEISELNLEKELDLAIHDPSKSKVVDLIERAKKIAYNCILPLDFSSYLWRDLSDPERFYIKGLEGEKHGNYQISTYQEYARGFALSSYSQLMANERANTARLKTPVEFAMRTVTDLPVFENSPLRIVLAAIHIAIKEDSVPEKGLYHIKNNLLDYWGSRDMVKGLLNFIRDTKDISNMPHWAESADIADQIYVLVDNDHI